MEPDETSSWEQALPEDDSIRAAPGTAKIALPLSRNASAFLIVLAALSALLALDFVAPDYFTARGFPLDDAWIPAV
jgi:hypothetical protein